jgi:hypothetical protein
MKPTALMKRFAVAGAAGIALFMSISRSDEASQYHPEAKAVSAKRAILEHRLLLDRLRPIPVRMRYVRSERHPAW